MALEYSIRVCRSSAVAFLHHPLYNGLPPLRRCIQHGRGGSPSRRKIRVRAGSKKATEWTDDGTARVAHRLRPRVPAHVSLTSSWALRRAHRTGLAWGVSLFGSPSCQSLIWQTKHDWPSSKPPATARRLRTDRLASSPKPRPRMVGQRMRNAFYTGLPCVSDNEQFIPGRHDRPSQETMVRNVLSFILRPSALFFMSL